MLPHCLSLLNMCSIISFFNPATPTRPSPRSRWLSSEDVADLFLLKRAESCVSSMDGKQHVRNLTAAWRLSGSASEKPVPMKSSDEAPDMLAAQGPICWAGDQRGRREGRRPHTDDTALIHNTNWTERQLQALG